MRQLTYLLLALLMVSCTGPKSILDLETLPPYVETSIHGINLQDAASAEAVLGKNIDLKEENGQYHAHYYNDDGYQILSLTYHPGDRKHQFSELAVTKVDKPGIVKMKVLPEVIEFKTGKGIKPGMTMDEVKEKLGAPQDKKIDNFAPGYQAVTLYYRYDQDDYFRKNKLTYYGEYEFVNNKLKIIMFGLKKAE